MDDTSLDDFLAAGSEAAPESRERDPDAEASDSPSDSEAIADDEMEADIEASGDTVDPATTTSQWDGGGVVCSGCAETVHRVWESADGLVCVTCKEW